MRICSLPFILRTLKDATESFDAARIANSTHAKGARARIPTWKSSRNSCISRTRLGFTTSSQPARCGSWNMQSLTAGFGKASKVARALKKFSQRTGLNHREKLSSDLTFYRKQQQWILIVSQDCGLVRLNALRGRNASARPSE